jgi:large subunit ribosomal protein L3
MVKGLWGKKIGMTQIFANDAVIPVTAIDISHWLVTNIRTKERDGYDAVQVGCLKKRYNEKTFSADWLKKLTQYFSFIKEIRTDAPVENMVIGQSANFQTIFTVGETVDVTGTTKGCGFAGVVKRHGFAGGGASHGSMFHRKPGAAGSTRAQGRIFKGKRYPGHMGVQQRIMRNLDVVKIEEGTPLLLVKGSVPGKTGSLVFVRKALK